MSQGQQQNFHFLWCLSLLDPQEMQWYPWPSETDASFRCKQCTGQARPIDVRQMTEVTVGSEKLLVVTSFCYLGDCLSSVANSTSSCPSSPPAHFPSPPEEEFTIHMSGVPCSMQAKPGPQTHPICITCNAMTKPWFTPDVQCHHQGPKVTLHLQTQMAWPCRT